MLKLKQWATEKEVDTAINILKSNNVIDDKTVKELNNMSSFLDRQKRIRQILKNLKSK